MAGLLKPHSSSKSESKSSSSSSKKKSVYTASDGTRHKTYSQRDAERLAGRLRDERATSARRSSRYSVPIRPTSDRERDVRTSYNIPSYTKNSFVSTSDPVRSEEQRLSREVFALRPNDPYLSIQSIGENSNNMQNLIDSRMKEMDARLRRQEYDTRRSFDDQIESEQEANRNELGAFTTKLANIGGYLGDSASHLGAIGSLNRAHSAEIATLEQKRAEAIQKARDAISDSQFQLAQLAVQEAREAEKMINDRRDTYFNQTLQMENASLSRDRLGFDMMKDSRDFAIDAFEQQLDMYVASGMDIPAEDIMSASRALGVSPQVIQNAIAAKQRSFELQEKVDKSNFDMDIIDTLTGVPRGTYVEIGGQTYEGLGDSSSTTAGVSTEPLTSAELQAFGLPAGSTWGDAQGMYAVSPERREAINAFDNALSMIDNLEKLTLSVNTDPGNIAGSIAATVSGPFKWLSGKLGTDTDSAAFISAKKSYLSMLSRALGEKGVLTDADISRVKAAIPEFNDNSAVAARKIAELRGIMTEIKESRIQSLTSPFSKGEQSAVKTSASRDALVNDLIKAGRAERLKDTDILNGLKQSDEQIGSFIDQMIKEKATPSEIIQYLEEKGNQGKQAMALSSAIAMHESGGKPQPGLSGEYGIYQFMPATWETVSKEVLGYVAPQTIANEQKVAEEKMYQLLQKGRTPRQIALIWNGSLAGSEEPVEKRGVNSAGVKYDTIAYANNVMKYYQQFYG